MLAFVHQFDKTILVACSDYLANPLRCIAKRIERPKPKLVEILDIQNLNKFGLGPLDALCDASQRIREVVAAGDEDGFVELMHKGKQYLALRG